MVISVATFEGCDLVATRFQTVCVGLRLSVHKVYSCEVEMKQVLLELPALGIG